MSEKKTVAIWTKTFQGNLLQALYLRRHIWISSTYSSDCKDDKFAQTEVWQLQVAIWGYQNIFRF